MTEKTPERIPEQPGIPRSTGHPAVDAVVDDLDGLAERPAADHVAVFESAHERLRAALADASTPSRSASSDSAVTGPTPTPAS